MNDEGRFLGRADERRRWRGLLSEVTSSAPLGSASYVVLIHGIGGLGKSRLTRLFAAMARGQQDGPPVGSGDPLPAIVVDLETERERRPERYPPLEGPSTGTLLYTLERALVEARGKAAEDAFAQFRDVLAQVLSLVTEADRQRLEEEERGMTLTDEERQGLERAVSVVAGLAGVAIADPTISAGFAVTGVAARGAGFVRRRWQHRTAVEPLPGISQRRIDLSLDPERVLVDTFAGAVGELAGKHGLVIAIDTAEIATESLRVLREVAKASGSKTVWIVSGRFESPAEAGYTSVIGEFQRAISDDRFAEFALPVFDRSLQREYLESRLGHGRIDEDDLARIDQATHGIPLALWLVVELIQAGASLNVLEEFIGEQGEANTVVRQLARCFLSHALFRARDVKNPLHEDVPAIFGLAVDEAADVGKIIGYDLRRRITASLIGVEPDELGERLDHLARRHDFVAPTGRLHEEVAGVFRLYLLDTDERLRHAAMHHRVCGIVEEELEQRFAAVPIGLRLADDRWRILVAMYIRHRFWASNREGLSALLDVFPAAAVLEPAFAGVLEDIATRFYPTATADEQSVLRGLHWPTNSSSFLDEWLARRRAGDRPSPASVSRVGGMTPNLRHAASGPDVEAAQRAMQQPLATFRLGGDDQTRQGLLEILAARLRLSDGQGEQAVSHIEAADALVEFGDSRIDSELSRVAGEVARRLFDTDTNSTQRALDLAQLASRRDATNTNAVFVEKDAHLRLGALDAALAVVDREIERDPTSARAQSERAWILRQLARAPEALVSAREAVRLDPDEAWRWGELAAALLALEKADEALAVADEGVSRSPASSAAQANRAWVLGKCDRNDEGLVAAEEAVRLQPRLAWAHTTRAFRLAFLGRLQEALDAADQAVTLRPLDDGPAVARAWILLLLGRPEEGLVAVDKAISLAPYDGDHRELRGRLLEALGRVPEALAEYEAALTARSVAVTAHCHRGLLRILESDAGGWDDLEAAVANTTENAGALVVLGARRWREGYADGARELAASALEARRGYASAVEYAEWRAVAHAMLGRSREDGLAALRDALPQWTSYSYRPALYQMLRAWGVPDLDEIEATMARRTL